MHHICIHQIYGSILGIYQVLLSVGHCITRATQFVKSMRDECEAEQKQDQQQQQ